MILGLDISTTMVGCAIIDPSTKKLVRCENWDISKLEKIYEKSETIGAEISTLRSDYNIEHVFVETALKKFLPGRSRADTIIKLAKFNGIVSWLCYECLDIYPTYINVNTARSLYGKKKQPFLMKWLAAEEIIKKEPTTALMRLS